MREAKSEATQSGVGNESTATSLLEGLRHNDSDAWARLVDLWTPLIWGYCRRRGFTQQDAEEITQEVLTRIYKGLSGFERDGAGKRFRFWVMAIVRNEIADFCRRRNGSPAPVGGSDYRGILESIPESDETADSEQFELVKIVARVLEVIRADFQEKNWQAFELVEFRKLSNQEAGEQVGLTANAVRQATYRIRRRIQEELAGTLH